MTMKQVIQETCHTEEEVKLFRAVIKNAGYWKEIWEYLQDYRDASTGVGNFIYYSDTTAFAKRHLLTIILCLNELELALGECLNKPNDDETTLLNWYAWFALEHIIDKVLSYKESLGE